MPLDGPQITASNADKCLLLAIAEAHRTLSAEYQALPKWQQSWLPMSRLREAHEQGWIPYDPSAWFPGISRYGRNAASKAIRRLENDGLLECNRPLGRTTHVRLTELGHTEAIAWSSSPFAHT